MRTLKIAVTVPEDVVEAVAAAARKKACPGAASSVEFCARR
jgi:hypothetical protein